MSLVTNTNHPFSNVAIRLEKLQNLYQVLTKNKSNQHISKAFANLAKIDRHVLCTMNSRETIGRKHTANKLVIKNAVKGRIETLKKTKRAFQTGVAKDQAKGQRALPNFSKQQSKNPLVKLPQGVFAYKVIPFLTVKETAALRSSCRVTRQIQIPASSIIKTYKLEGLIETYLHVPSSDYLTPSDKVKTLHKLLSLAYSLSEVEKLHRPTYSSLPTFFQEVEARNLIRMIEAIRDAKPLPDLPVEIEDLRIPNNPTTAMQKAGHLRNWIHQHQGALAAIDGDLDLAEKDLSLLPKEIGQLQALEWLQLDSFGHWNGFVCATTGLSAYLKKSASYGHCDGLIWTTTSLSAYLKKSVSYRHCKGFI